MTAVDQIVRSAKIVLAMEGRPHMRALASSYFISRLPGLCHCGAVDLIDQGGAPINTGLPCKPHVRRD
jgi:hypothetical protein